MLWFSQLYNMVEQNSKIKLFYHVGLLRPLIHCAKQAFPGANKQGACMKSWQFGEVEINFDQEIEIKYLPVGENPL